EKGDAPDQDQGTVQGRDGLKIGQQGLHIPNIGNQRLPRRAFMASTILKAAGQMATFFKVRWPICWNFFRSVWGNSRQALGLWSYMEQWLSSPKKTQGTPWSTWSPSSSTLR